MKSKLIGLIILIVFMTIGLEISVARDADRIAVRGKVVDGCTYYRIVDFWYDCTYDIDVITCNDPGEKKCPKCFTDAGVAVYDCTQYVPSFNDNLTLHAILYMEQQTSSNVFSGNKSFITTNPVDQKEYITTINWDGDEVDMSYHLRIFVNPF